MGTKDKPRELKVLRGTLQACRDNGDPGFSLPESTDPPDWLLDPVAVEMWNRLIGVLKTVLRESDLVPLGHLCNQHASIVSTIRERKRPTAAEYTQFRLMAESFGMTPSSRSKVGLGGTKPHTNRFAKYASGA